MDLEKAMQFVIEQLARLEAAAAKHDEQIAQNAVQIAQNAVQIEKNTTQIAQNTAQIASVTDLVGRLAQSEIVLTERMDKGFREFREILAQTDYKLNALIDTVDKLVRRNGNTPKV
ncbi:MAG TPA: hypothetical protein VKW70_02665 [Terriglobia bacterium]|nr:hypothetical protein [Terriglobia bacterium]